VQNDVIYEVRDDIFRLRLSNDDIRRMGGDVPVDVAQAFA
jgi:hypothetical protein